MSERPGRGACEGLGRGTAIPALGLAWGAGSGTGIGWGVGVRQLLVLGRELRLCPEDPGGCLASEREELWEAWVSKPETPL